MSSIYAGIAMVALSLLGVVAVSSMTATECSGLVLESNHDCFEACGMVRKEELAGLCHIIEVIKSDDQAEK